MASFFVRAAAGQYDLEQPDQLLRLLVVMTRHKLANQERRHRAEMRDCRRLAECDPAYLDGRTGGPPAPAGWSSAASCSPRSIAGSPRRSGCWPTCGPMAASGPRSPPGWAAPPRHAASNWPARSIASSSSSRGERSAMTELTPAPIAADASWGLGGAERPGPVLVGLVAPGSAAQRRGLPGRADIRDPDQIVAVLRVDQWERCRLGQWVPAETYLDAFPAVRDQAEHAVELIFAEYLLREELGEQPALEEYLGRFPQYAGELQLQLELHQAIDADGEPLTDSAERTMTLGDRREIESGAGSEGLPDIPGYEVLGVLGRGGMGVVYRAWQKGLNRLVAVKMVHAGAQADPKVLARFRVEAEAVARLQHPNIVQIHEVGQHAGSPFLVLELVEGRSLAQWLAGTPRPARQAAELLETLARAVHCAHRQGVVHRDLTPANILLTADGPPKITDFGLAKLIIGGGDLRTQTGELWARPATWRRSRRPADTRRSGRRPTSTPWVRSSTSCSPAGRRSRRNRPWRPCARSWPTSRSLHRGCGPSCPAIWRRSA